MSGPIADSQCDTTARSSFGSGTKGDALASLIFNARAGYSFDNGLKLKLDVLTRGPTTLNAIICRACHASRLTASPTVISTSRAPWPGRSLAWPFVRWRVLALALALRSPRAVRPSNCFRVPPVPVSSR
jgi:hypothetical protein